MLTLPGEQIVKSSINVQLTSSNKILENENAHQSMVKIGRTKVMS